MKKFSSIFFLLFILIFCFTGEVFSAEIENGPGDINGQFMTIHIPCIKHSVTSGGVVSESASDGLYEIISEIPSLPFSEEFQNIQPDFSNELPENASKIHKIDGETLYQLETDYPVFHADKNLLSSLSGTGENPATIGTQRDFYVYNYRTQSPESSLFTCYYTSTSCEVFVQNSLTYSSLCKENIAELIGDEFSSNIHPYLTESLTDYTGYYGTHNGRIVILVENIIDNYGITSSGYTAGYFLPSIKNVVHIDTYPLMKTSGADSEYTEPTNDGIRNSFATVAHEFTHNLEKNLTPNSPVWYSEFFAISTEASLYPDDTADEKFLSFISGSPFVKFGSVLNYTDYETNSNNIGTNYGVLYLFQNYIRCLTEYTDSFGNIKTDVFRTIFDRIIYNSTFEDAMVDGINSELARLGKGFSFSDFDDLVSSFYIAFTLQEDDGKYSFNGTGNINNLTMPLSDNRIRGLAGSTIVVPLLNQGASPVSSAYQFTAFSRTETPEITSVSYFDATHPILYDRVDLTYKISFPHFAVNNYTNYVYNSSTGRMSLNQNCTDLFDGVYFIPSSDAIYPLRNGDFYLLYNLGNDEHTFNLAIQSIDRAETYDVIAIHFDPKSTVGITSFVTSPVISENTLNHRISVTSADNHGQVPLYSAIYDAETGKLLDANYTLKTLSHGTLSRGVSIPPLNIPQTESGRYLTKLFTLKGDNSLTPLSSNFGFYFQLSTQGN